MFKSQFPPFIEIKSTAIHSLEGYDGQIIKTIAKYLNLTIDLVDCGKKWGNKQIDGTWDGLVGAVNEKVILKIINLKKLKK